MSEIPKPVNTEERYMHAMVMRLDALCHMMDSFIKEYAKQHNVATTKNTKTTTKATAKKETKKVTK